jgi:hypothetical protein
VGDFLNSKNSVSMKKITFLIFICAFIQAQGQTTLERRTINAQSGTSPVNNFYVSWSIGEPIVGTVQAGNYTLTQGFQQPEKRGTVTQPPSVSCMEYAAANTNQKCNPSTWQPYGLKIGTEFFQADQVRFQKRADGTAKLTGTFRDATWKAITVSINLSAYTTTAAANRTNCLTANSSVTDWFFYPQWSGTIQRVGQPPLSINSTSPMQIGTGANTQDISELGASGNFSSTTGQTGLLALKFSNPTACSTIAAAQSNAVFTAQGRSILNRIQLDWVENTAEKGDVFLVQKSQNGQFETIATVQAAEGVNSRYYIAYDENPTINEDNTYRITLLKNNGNRRESAEIVVNMSKLLDFSVHPNPATDEVWIDLKAFEGRSIEILLSDIAGKVIRREKVEKATATPHRLDVGSMESGAYFLTIQTVGKNAVVRKLSIMK